MFIIDITLNTDLIPEEKAEKLLEGHRNWFRKNFEEGKFLIVGPYKNRGMAGVVIARGESKEEIEKVIVEDSYYPEMASYEISEFTANLIAENLTQYTGK